jgi:Cys-rich protein (TIGR01571 family)
MDGNKYEDSVGDGPEQAFPPSTFDAITDPEKEPALKDVHPYLVDPPRDDFRNSRFACYPCCLNGDNADRMGDNGCLWFLFACFCPCLATFFQRRLVRKRLSIKGSCPVDFVASLFCPFCVNARIANDLDAKMIF